MAAEKKNPYEAVSAAPVKSFFVYMLTRDIRLEDAILDLLDNCVDGILRSKADKAPKASKTSEPYRHDDVRTPRGAVQAPAPNAAKART